MVDKESVQELLNVCEQHLTNLSNNLDDREQLEMILDDALDEISQKINEAWDNGYDMTNEND